eukprot:IDg13279t1
MIEKQQQQLSCIDVCCVPRRRSLMHQENWRTVTDNGTTRYSTVPLARCAPCARRSHFQAIQDTKNVSATCRGDACDLAPFNAFLLQKCPRFTRNKSAYLRQELYDPKLSLADALCFQAGHTRNASPIRDYRSVFVEVQLSKGEVAWLSYLLQAVLALSLF